MRVKYLLFYFWGFLFSLQLFGQKKLRANDGKIEVVFLQVNDVYEISPLDQGKAGGIARLATIRKELMKYNPRTYTVVAGDFLSPSAIGTILNDTPSRKKIAGMQMLESLNSAGLDLAVFGNHEFDISAVELKDAINRSTFDWVSSNVKLNDSAGRTIRFAKVKNGKTIPIPTTRILSFRDEDGTMVRIGVFGLTLATPGKRRYEAYDDYYTSAAAAIKELKGKCDLIVALTHLEIGMDRMLAEKFPEIKLIIGGHEHANSYETVGKTVIAKADANARTAYVHSVNYNSKTRNTVVKSRLVVINNAVAGDTATGTVVTNWNNRAYTLLKNQGFNPCEIIDSAGEVLDGREAYVRTQPTNLGELIGQSMTEALVDPADCAIYNSGSIRVDDVLTGYLTQYDIFRILPFENKIVVKKLQGYIIDSLLKSNPSRRNDGSFLQYSGITKKDSGYYIGERNLYADTNWYRVAMNNYLATGLQGGLNFIGTIYPPAEMAPRLKISINDMRLALIEKLGNRSKKTWPFNNKTVPCY